MVVIGLDLGTTVCKAGLFDATGKLSKLVRREYPVTSDYPGWAEQNPDVVWNTIQMVLSEIATDKQLSDPIKAICISAQGEAVVFLDQWGRPLRNSILGMDMRSVEQAEGLKSKLGAEWFLETPGVPPHPLTTVAKILWVKEHEPEIAQKTVRYLCYEDFAFFKLGDVPAIDYSLACRTGLFDMRKKKWSAKILDYTGINEDQLANIYPSGEAIGKINRKIAHTLGLPTDVLLVTGGHDVTCAALGAGAINKGVGGDILGTAEIFGVTVESNSVAKKIRPNNFACYCHVVPNKFWLMTLNQTCGLLLRWYRDNFGEPEVKLAEKEGKDAFDLIVSKSKPDIAESMVLPHFVGSGTPWIDARSKGAIVGLSIHTNKADIIRAMLEAVIYEQKISIDIFEKYGVDVREIRAVGGGSKSRFWLQMRSDILGKTVLTLETEEASCLGTAILANYALGNYPSIENGAEQMVKMKDRIEPNKKLYPRYQQRYLIYQELYPALKKINYSLQQISSRGG